jgi:four helix bundle protein
MKTVKQFEDLRCWQNARQLATMIYLLDSCILTRDFSTRDQFRKAALSVMNNIAEGFTRFSAKEMIRFFEIAQSSSAEVLSMLHLLEDIGYLDKDTCTQLREQTELTRWQILGFIRSLHRRYKV